MLPPRVSEHNWWWCAWRSKTPQWPHWLSRARLPGSRTSFCAQTWHRPGGVQITGTLGTGSRTGIICTVKTPGRCQGTQVMLCKWNMTSDTNSHVGCHYQLQNQGSSQDATAECWLSAERLSETPHIWGQGLIPAASRSHRVSQDHWPRKILWTVIFYWCNLKSWTCHHLFPKVKGWPQNQD